MGLRGIGAKKKIRLIPGERQEPRPWESKNTSRAERVIAFVQALKVTSGTHANTKLKLRPWQREFIKAIYNRDRNGKRNVRTAILSMGRKNGKTQLAAALALCHLSGPESEQRGEIYSCANDRFQSGKIFNEMAAMILNDDWLSARTNVLNFQKDIVDLKNGSIYSALTSEAKTKMGLSPSFVVYDELGQTTNRYLYDAMDSAMGARKEPLLLVISTQAADDYAPLSQLIDYGLKVKTGDITDPSFHLTLYSAAEDDDPWTRETWDKANPALGDFRSLEDVQRLSNQAQRIPSQENSFRNLILNQRVAATARFMEPSIWKANGGAPNIPLGAKVYAGLDIGSTRDLSALVLVYPNPIDGTYHVQPYCWIPGNVQARADAEHIPFDVWVKQGALTPAGEATDPRLIANKIAEVNSQNPIIALAFDRWRMAEIKRELDQIGCPVKLEPHGQGFKDMSPAVDVVERMTIAKKLRHGGHPVLTMCANNAVVVKDPAGGRKFDKAKSTVNIDAMVALAMALSLACVKVPKAFDIDTLIA